MEGVIFCCPPAWRKLLPPGVLGAERAEALAEQYWPLLVLTRRGCGELGIRPPCAGCCWCRGIVPRRWSASRRRRWSPMACPPGIVSPCPAWRNRSSASSGNCPGRAAAWWSPRNFHCRNFRLLRRSCCRCWACGCCSCHRQVPPLCGRLKTKRGGCNMAWHEILATGIILAGTAFYCWAAYSRKSGPTSCIGCGKCVADGVCILTGKKVPGISGGKGKNL